MQAKDYIDRCEGLGCAFKEKCARYQLYKKDKEDLKYSLCLIPHLADTCAEYIDVSV